MAMDTLDDGEWREIRRGEGEIGYAFVTPGTEWPGETAAAPATVSGSAESIQLDTGALTPDQLRLILTHLPVEISFVDTADEVRFYSDNPERIFPRSPGVIGRKVQNCHPPKSVHIVERILSEFKAGAKNSADFWIETGGKFVLIRYVAVRDKNGAYRGTLEITQDVTGIRELEGERRLLDWDAK
jgi:DUF438 domain-containing protein